jgi:hypothetical protein
MIAGTLKNTFSGMSIYPPVSYIRIADGSQYYMTCGLDRRNGDDVEGLDIFFTGPDGERLQSSQ